MAATEERKMTVSEAVDKRHSTRKFLSERRPDIAVIGEILSKASRAPSGGNTQPWHLHVVYGEARDKLVATFQEAIMSGAITSATDSPQSEFRVYPPAEASKAFMERRRSLAFEMFKLMGIERNDASARVQALLDNFTFFGAPVGIFVTVDRIVDRNGWGHVGMLVQNICLLAAEYGISTCLQEAWANGSELVRSHLSIPDDQVVWCGIALGYADPSAPVNTLRSQRVPLLDFTTFYGVAQDQLDKLPAKL